MTEKKTAPRPLVVCVLDGWGWREESAGNAVALANAPNWKRFFAEGPRSFLATSGPAVGLPEGQMGNSEVGHMNIGSGRVLVQDLDRIGAAIAGGTLARDARLKLLFEKAKPRALHLLGLLSPGGVHSHMDHLATYARLAAKAGVRVFVHAFLDGRDTPPQSAKDYLAEFASAVAVFPDVAIATVSGRFYAMDRDKRWERTAQAYETLVDAKGKGFADAQEAIAASYRDNVTDEFVVPCVIGDYKGMHDGDALLMANFRADRVRQILSALLDPDFAGFARPRAVKFSAALGATEYSAALAKLIPPLFPPQDAPNGLGEYLAARGLKQLRLAETEKYAHVTFFFNCGRETVYPGEDRILVPSPKVRTYDLKPEMSAYEVTDRLVEAIGSGKYDLIVVNYANADMVGHSGDLAAAVKALEAVDRCLGRVREALARAGGVMLLTSDHGNAEMMRDPLTGAPHTAHTTFDVPLMLVNAQALGRGAELRDGRLCDIAPTVLQLMNLPVPAGMTGRTLLASRARREAAE